MSTNSYSLKEWVVIGAGLHGVHICCRLLDAGVTAEKLLLLDRHPPLSLWNQRTGQLDMGYLRSTSVHHLDICPWSLLTFARSKYGRDENWSAPPYTRPSYLVFQEHCRFVMEKFDIPSIYRQSMVERLKRRAEGGFELETTEGLLSSQNVVLALGQACPRTPGWARKASSVHHLLDETPLPEKLGPRIAVVGAGMTGAQFALAHSENREVTLLNSSQVKVADFDADPCWIGPKCLNQSFWDLTAVDKRRTILEARQKGTVNNQVHGELCEAIERGQLNFLPARVVDADSEQLYLSDGDTLPFDTLVLATGFEGNRPGGSLVDQAIEDFRLPTSPCGFPLVSTQLEWEPGLFVSGGLAELQLGPAARNISGARAAGKRVADRYQELRSEKPPARVWLKKSKCKGTDTDVVITAQKRTPRHSPLGLPGRG